RPLPHRTQMILGARARDPSFERPALVRGHLVADVAENACDVQPRIPELQVAHRGEAPHRLSVRAYCPRPGTPLPPPAPPRPAAASPTSRPAMAMLAASRLTSHSHGPQAVSSKSLM